MIKYHSSSPYAPCILSDSTSVFFLRTSYLGMIKKIFARFRSTGTHVHCLENFPRWFSSALKGKRKTNLEIKHTLVGIFGPNRLTKLHYIIHDLSLSLSFRGCKAKLFHRMLVENFGESKTGYPSPDWSTSMN